MAESQEASIAEHTGKPDKDSVDPAASDSGLPTVSANGNSSDDSTSEASAISADTKGMAVEAGTSETVKNSAEDLHKVSEMVKADDLLTLGETVSADSSQSEIKISGALMPKRETASKEDSQTEIKSADALKTERETANKEDSQTERETASKEDSQTERETDSKEDSQTERETDSANDLQTVREAVSTDKPSADASQVEGETASADALQTETDPVSADALETDPVSADALETDPVSEDAVETDPVSTDALETDPVSVDALETDPVSGDALETDPVSADALETDPVSADALETDPVSADALETDPVSADALETDPVSADALETDPVSADALETDPVSADALETDSVSADALEIDPVGADALQTEINAVGADALQTETDPVGADALQTETDSVGADALLMETDTVGAETLQTETDALLMQTDTVRVDALKTEREAVSADNLQVDRETTSADNLQVDRETTSADSLQTERETAIQEDLPRVGKTVCTDAHQAVEETLSTNAAQSNGQTLSTDIPLDMGVEDADDDMEVSAIKLEDDQMLEEENVKGMPVISSVVEGSNIDTLSSSSLDHGDEVENMDIGADALKEEDIESSSKTQPVGNVDSMPSIVDTVSLTEDTEQPGKQHGFKNTSGLSAAVGGDQSEDVKPIRPISNSSSETIPIQNKKDKDSAIGLKNGVAGKPSKVVGTSQLAADPVSTNADAISVANVKDEPVDEEYDQALAPAVTTEAVKDEPDTAEELRISNVFSVGGAPTSIAASTGVAALPKSTLPSLAPASASIPPLIPMAMRVACSACKKVLLKGQTAYQRKGSSDLFCSTSCLTSYSPPPPIVKMVTSSMAKKTCHYCLKDIANPKDVISSPVDTTGTLKDFCGQSCLYSFNFKRNSAVSTLSSTSSTGVVKCSMCKKTCVSKHEVVFQSTIHRLCSEVCFMRFRSNNKLSMNSCQSCNKYCHGKVTVLVVQGSSKTFCSAGCVTTFKQKIKKPASCTMCRNNRLISEMVESADADGKLELFCSTGCITAHKVQTVSSSGAQVVCNTCGQKTVPSFHLAMSDGSIRNFCAMNCVVTFQEQFNKGNMQNPMNVATGTGTSAPPVVQTRDRGPQGAKLPCFQCHRLFSTKPELIQFKDKMVFLCSLNCSEEYRKINYEMARCEYCKIEKPAKEVKRINKKDYVFCSEGCKLLYKHDLAKRWGKHCRNCAYCASTSQKVMTGQYGGKMEEFCSDECKSHYTLLFCQVAKCDACERQGKLIETLPMLGEVKHFCNLQCLLHFCSQQTQNQGKLLVQKAISIASSTSTTTTTSSSVTARCDVESNPVIANVVSLASSPTGQPNLTSSTLQGSLPSRQVKYVGNASTQTQAPRPPPPKVQKNKALLCKPMVQNKGVMCKPTFTTTGCQTEDDFPKVIVVPIPVPVYVPVPMNMYSQYSPRPVGLPIPLPVPMFLPVTLDSAESIVETIQEIKEKIPSDPFEADLILMAEMVAEEGREKSPERHPEKPAAIPDDQGSTFSGDLDTDELTNFLTTWNDEPPPTPGISSRHSRPYAQEDIAVPPSPPPPVMDLEADFPVQSLELMAHWRDQEKDKSPSPPSTPLRRRGRKKARDGFPPKKKTRKSKAWAKVVEEPTVARSDVVPGTPPKLQYMYGVDAWKRWVEWRNTQPDVEKPRFGSRPMEIKEDVLKCTTAELGYGLCRFICEVKRPNGEAYSQDSLFYLCLGIQQYLFDNGRMENIFTDLFYGKFTMEITKLLKGFQPTITSSGYIHSRVEEEYLWECKQLGAYSPIVLLNTLLFFCTKFFQFKTVAQHRQLSFAHVMRCSKSIYDNTKSNFLRFYPPIPKKDQTTETADAEGSAAKRKREEEEKEEVLEMMENSENPLRCPVRLYEFYLSKCSDSVKQRTNVFFLHPERSCVPNSPMWFSSQGLDDNTMDTMLTRILMVREVHLVENQKIQTKSNDPDYTPDRDSDSE